MTFETVLVARHYALRYGVLDMTVNYGSITKEEKAMFARTFRGLMVLSLLALVGLLVACTAAAPAPSAPAPAAPTTAAAKPAEQKPAEAPKAAAPTQAPAAAAKPADTPKAAAPAAPAVAKGGNLVYGIYTRFDTLDPTVTTFSVVGTVGYHIFDPYVWQTSAGKFEPGLAESWTISPDGTEYTLKLRQNVKFHDGTPFNAEAVKFTFDRIIDPETKSQSAKSLLGPYDSSTVVDANTVRIKFKQPFAPFMNSLSLPYLAPQSPTAVKAAAKDYGVKTVVGTGPFKFTSYRVDQELKLEKNADYKWGPAHLTKDGGPFLETLTFRIIPEDNTRSATLQSGELTFADSLPAAEFKNLSAVKELEILSPVQAGSGHSVMMNVTNPPLDDVKIRQALEWATDKQGLINTVFNGVFKPACSPLTSNLLGYDAKACDKYKFDQAKAGALLDEAGWKLNASTGVREKDGKPLKLGFYFRSDSNNAVGMATFLQNNWKKVGVDLDMQGLAQQGYFDAVRAGKHHFQFWWETNTDPDVVRTLLHSKNADGGTNRNRYKNADMDKLIDAAAAESDPVKRAAAYAPIQQKVLDDAVMIYLADPLTIVGGNVKLKGEAMDWGGNYPQFHAAWIEK
jgi:peptide/nickel transport system substrate-binding protein